jgi:hypothetical protein
MKPLDARVADAELRALELDVAAARQAARQQWTYADINVRRTPARLRLAACMLRLWVARVRLGR